jgi:hydrogenase maturation protein HypF
MWEATLADLHQGVDRPRMALRFHSGLAVAFAAAARRLVINGDAKAVALSGGCFQNALLLDLTVTALGDVPVLQHTKVPSNDGSLALGQALIASATHRNNR